VTVILTEQDAAAVLDAALGEIGLFHVLKEVSGVLMQPQAAQVTSDISPRRLRIDRLLLPTPRLTGLGWASGAVGVEIKSSDRALEGPVLSQALDYRRCLWMIPNGGIRVWLDWLFIFPLEAQHGPLASLMAHNRIGTCASNNWTRLHFKTGEQNILKIYHDGQVDIGQMQAGRKAGSR
jgi:hypothetical protein